MILTICTFLFRFFFDIFYFFYFLFLSCDGTDVLVVQLGYRFISIANKYQPSLSWFFCLIFFFAFWSFFLFFWLLVIVWSIETNLALLFLAFAGVTMITRENFRDWTLSSGPMTITIIVKTYEKNTITYFNNETASYSIVIFSPN